MKIAIKNLGAIKQAEFTLGDFTIICGCNNTGKTYATHATYAFFDYLRSSMRLPIEKDIVNRLLSEGAVSIQLDSYINDIKKHLSDAARSFSKILHSVFAGNEKNFEDSTFNFSLEQFEVFKTADIQMHFGTAEKSILKIKTNVDTNRLDATLIMEKSADDVPPLNLIESMLSDSIRKAVLSTLVPRPFLASAERTGAAIFQKELDFTRNRLVEMLGDKSTKLNPVQFLGKFRGEYPIAVRRNVDFIRELPNIDGLAKSYYAD